MYVHLLDKMVKGFSIINEGPRFLAFLLFFPPG